MTTPLNVIAFAPSIVLAEFNVTVPEILAAVVLPLVIAPVAPPPLRVTLFAIVRPFRSSVPNELALAPIVTAAEPKALA